MWTLERKIEYYYIIYLYLKHLFPLVALFEVITLLQIITICHNTLMVKN